VRRADPQEVDLLARYSGVPWWRKNQFWFFLQTRYDKLRGNHRIWYFYRMDKWNVE
jgi:hypothetical protein